MGRLMLKEKLIIIITLVMLLCACNMQEQQTQLAQIKAQNKIRQCQQLLPSRARRARF